LNTFFVEQVDRGHIKRDIVRWHQKYPLYQIFADRAYAMDLLIDLFNEESIQVKGIPQGAVTLNESCRLLEDMVESKQIEHGSNPILDWNVANASVSRNATGLMCLDRSSSTERIDGLAALINALAAYIADPEHRGPSPYDSGGIFII
jgi:phage terminase large subunit-like protein